MTPGQPVTRPSTAILVRVMDVTAKAGLLTLLALALIYPELGHVRGKSAGLRSIGYPMLAFALPAIWLLFWRGRAPFPWTADLLFTIPCFTDTLGNRIDLYDSVVWFDDWIHLMNTGLLTAGVVVLTMKRTSGFGAILERALAFGLTAALGWEIAEYFAFVNDSSERLSAYPDTLGDLALGSLGAVVAAVVVYALWQSRNSDLSRPQFEPDVKPLDLPLP